MFVAWSKSLVILASSSYVERLWCIMELFTWVEMGCKIDAIKIYDIDGGASLDEDLSKFKVSRAKCYKLFDMHRLVAVIENAFGDHLNFENEVLQIVQMRRGRRELRRPPQRVTWPRLADGDMGREQARCRRGETHLSTQCGSFAVASCASDRTMKSPTTPRLR